MKAYVWLVLVTGAVAGITGCSLERRYGPRYTTAGAASELRPGAYREEGMASYYGREAHGKPTASGEKFNMNDYTAAHRTLPFGTRVRVTNLANNAVVVVRINDRGPFKEGRIIDVSYAAARRLKMLDAGVTRVEIEVVE